MEFVCFQLSAGSVLLGIAEVGVVLLSRLGFFGEGHSHSSFFSACKAWTSLCSWNVADYHGMMLEELEMLL